MPHALGQMQLAGAARPLQTIRQADGIIPQKLIGAPAKSSEGGKSAKLPNTGEISGFSRSIPP